MELNLVNHCVAFGEGKYIRRAGPCSTVEHRDLGLMRKHFFESGPDSWIK